MGLFLYELFLDKTEIDQNDVDMKIIAASLTRAQANAVRQRIDALNEAIRQRKLNDASPRLSHGKPKRNDVRDLFNLNSTSQLAREDRCKCFLFYKFCLLFN